MTPACKLDRCNSGRRICTDTRCQTDSALPPALTWLARELKAAAQIPRWIKTNRKAGFTLARSVWLAWRTTRPVR
jgi:hypothetical protein